MTYSSSRGRERAVKVPRVQNSSKHVTHGHEHTRPSTHPPTHRPNNPMTHQPPLQRCATAIQQSIAAGALIMIQTGLQLQWDFHLFTIIRHAGARADPCPGGPRSPSWSSGPVLLLSPHRACSLCQTIWTRGLPARDSPSITGLALDKSFLSSLYYHAVIHKRPKDRQHGDINPDPPATA